MKIVVVEQFGGVEQLDVRDEPTPTPEQGQVLVRLTSIGMNHAELMARRGEYKIASGNPPFTPGLEGGGVIEAVGPGVLKDRVGTRVTLSPVISRPGDDGFGGTYRSHYIAPSSHALPSPRLLGDEQLGTLWLSHLTAWGCLVWRHGIKPGDIVAIPAASSSVGLAASQVVRQAGGVAIGLTSSEKKVAQLEQLDAAMFDHLVVTHEPGEPDGDGRPTRVMKGWHREIKRITEGHGVDVFFDPVASGEYLNTEMFCLAQRGVVWVYGLLGQKGPVDVTPLIRKHAAIRGWVLGQLLGGGDDIWRAGCETVMRGFASGDYVQHVGGTFALDDVQQAHTQMEKGEHIGKLVPLP